MELSFWERETFLGETPFCIIGAGIVGLNAAIRIKEIYPPARVIVLERGLLPDGASTKNAGFACFGSPSELLDDLKQLSEEEVFSLVAKRWEGLQAMRMVLRDEHIQYESAGGFEIFRESDTELLEECRDALSGFNRHLGSITGIKACYREVNPSEAKWGFQGIQSAIENKGEGLIHTGKMAQRLLRLAQQKGVEVWMGMEVVDLVPEAKDSWLIRMKNGLSVKAEKLLLAVNGFAKRFLPELDVEPARAQVLVTHPIPNLPFKGGFHYDKGYYYFRNIGDRILLGGGRNLDFTAENTMDKGLTPVVQESLESLLREVILPGRDFSIDIRWSGTMGIGKTKSAIIRQIEPHLYCAVRLGGMGVAIGTLVGRDAGELMVKGK